MYSTYRFTKSPPHLQVHHLHYADSELRETHVKLKEVKGTKLVEAPVVGLKGAPKHEQAPVVELKGAPKHEHTDTSTPITPTHEIRATSSADRVHFGTSKPHPNITEQVSRLHKYS